MVGYPAVQDHDVHNCIVSSHSIFLLLSVGLMYCVHLSYRGDGIGIKIDLYSSREP